MNAEVSYQTLRKRIQRGWPADAASAMPLMQGKSLRPRRARQREYTIDGEGGWTLQAVMAELPGANYDAIGKRLRGGVRSWKELRKPARVSVRRPAKAVPKHVRLQESRTLESVARENLERFERERCLLWLSWRGPVDPSPLVWSVGVQIAPRAPAGPCGFPPNVSLAA